ncbi:hypothetical protein CVT24_000560 [Panaeolus cyanescens]|uniref:ABC transporter domain-containing protein n=1 Tax=Panaeolus cyanescens TaxID=181874 RepID=A0A409VX86_9AGAR|nr:hypothetical protein CVT24_000560 [Panaeolus cyanescens]
MFNSRRRRAQKQTYIEAKGTFDPHAPTVKYEKIGIWDQYTEQRTLVVSLIPATKLSYRAQLLEIVQTAVDHRTVDSHKLFNAVLGSSVCVVASRFSQTAVLWITRPLNRYIRRFYSIHMFKANARLDVPTFDDPAVQQQLEQASPQHYDQTIAFSVISSIVRLFCVTLELFTSMLVLYRVLLQQEDSWLLIVPSFIVMFMEYSSVFTATQTEMIWAATTNNKDFVQSEGLKGLISNPIHRKEIVASGLAPFIIKRFQQVVQRMPIGAAPYRQSIRDHKLMRWQTSLYGILIELLRGSPELIFAVRAVQKPMTVPVSLASLELITSASTAFAHTIVRLARDTASISESCLAVRQLYQINKIPNKVAVKPTKMQLEAQAHLTRLSEENLGLSFPENAQSLASGISVEFRNVSFRYPDSPEYALHNVSFKIEKGQLCVIVGNNGSGKSTILKLIARLYDPCEGQILVDGIDISTIRLGDLRRAISVLFQDYTLFPVSVKDNIAFGDPYHDADFSKIEQAAKLGGADAFIEKLPEKYEEYLQRPGTAQDQYSSLPEGTTTLFGRPVDLAGVRSAFRGGSTTTRGLSGGQQQRIALSRMFMRSVVSEGMVGLLLFDEPSASLDPTAEHDLFERLRKLRMSKTMIFSSHRFGNLTKHADLILYINDSVVVEEGTHDELLRRGGDYCRVWNLQAQAFL